MSFQERRKAEAEARKAKRDGRRSCRVCGGAHPRRECPGVLDDGRGQGRWHDHGAKKRERRGRKESEKKAAEIMDALEVGLWTEGVLYYDGFADLPAAFQEFDRKAGGVNGSEASSLARWIFGWATMKAELGDYPTDPQTPEQLKKQLKNERVKVLREKALELTSDESQVELAMESGNPKSELIKIILSATPLEYRPKRLPQKEWPGYCGCVTPLSVLDPKAMEALKLLGEIDGSSCKIRVLLSIPPTQISKWVLLEEPDNEDQKIKSKMKLDLMAINELSSKIEHTKAKLEQANKQTKKDELSSEAGAARLEKILSSQHEEVSSVDIEAMTVAKLDPTVKLQLDGAISDALKNPLPCGDEGKLVVGISCGLDYRVGEAMSSFVRDAVQNAQREACEHAVKAAVAARLPLVLECHNASHQEAPPGDGQNEDLYQNADKQASSAVADLMKILVDVVPSDTTLILRSGSIMATQKPGLPRLLEVWPQLYAGFSSTLTYSKCPKEILDAVYDVPLERIILMSEAPKALPAVLGSSPVAQLCLPPHCACASERIVTLKGNAAGTSRDKILQTSTKNLCRALGLAQPTL